MASDRENKSSESELLIAPTSLQIDDFPENSTINLDNSSESSFEEEVRSSTRNKKPHPHCYLRDHETRGRLNEPEAELNCGTGEQYLLHSRGKSVRLCLACRTSI